MGLLKARRRRPLFSVVVATYNMDRELPRTLYSLSGAYQAGIDEDEYEVIVVDNGSNPPFGRRRVEAFGRNFSYHFVEDAPPSPAYAMNLGAKRARGAVLCMMIDGARLVTPGVMLGARRAFRSFDDPSVAVPGWHLGPDLQTRSTLSGYDKDTEDGLLEGIDWRAHGYRLFEIATWAVSCGDGWFSPMAETNALFMDKGEFLALGGYDERFDVPGGGFINLDLYYRAVTRPGSDLVVLLGEGTFHQLHGGVSTNVDPDVWNARVAQWIAQYQDIRGRPYRKPPTDAIYLGAVPSSVLPSVEFSAHRARELRGPKD